MTYIVGLNAYRIRIKKKGARVKRGISPWWEFQRGSANDGHSEIATYLRSRLESLSVYAEDRALLATELQMEMKTRCIDGLLIRGEGGTKRDILNIQTGTTTYKMGKAEAPMAPHYFRFILEDGRTYGILILQTFGKEGVKSALYKDMKNYFGSRDDDESLTIEFSQLVDVSVLQAFARHGLLRDVVLLNKGGSKAAQDELAKIAVGNESLGGEGDAYELRLHRKGGWAQGTLKFFEKLASGTAKGKFASLPGLSEFDDIRVRVKLGDRIQTFSMLSPDDNPIRADITADVKLGDNGYPTLSSLRDQGKQMYSDVILPLLQ